MIPLRHSERSSSFPYITLSIVSTNLIFFVMALVSPGLNERFLSAYSFVPARLFHPGDFHYSAAEALLTLVTSLFVHGGYVHLGGNMLYLWIFGRSVEERLGPPLFIVFYLAAGVAGSLTHAFVFPLSEVPSIGASGSIAGVLGAFLVTFPRARVVTLLPLIVYWAIAEIPAVVFLPLWFLMQFFNGWLTISSGLSVEEMSGVAWWTHIGGFVFGLLFGWWMKERRGRRNGIG